MKILNFLIWNLLAKELKINYYNIKYIKGPLLEALTTPNTAFLLDEANLSPIEILQALEGMIDAGYLV